MQTRIKPHKMREFRWIWLDVKGFKPWLKINIENPSRVYCKVCKLQILAMFSCLKRHALSNSHFEKSGTNKSPPQEDFIISDRKDSKEERLLAEAELKMADMSSALNIAFKNVPTIIKTKKPADKVSKIWTKLKMGKAKARNIAVNFIGEHEESYLR